MNLRLKLLFLQLIPALLLLQGNTLHVCDCLYSLSLSLSLIRNRAIEESPPPPVVPRANRPGGQLKAPLAIPQFPLPPTRRLSSENDRFTQSVPVNAMRPVHMRPKVRNRTSVTTLTRSVY